MSSAENFISILEVTSVITTVLQYMSGACLCLSYIKKKSTGDTSGFPFICGFLSCCLWIYYGVLSNLRSVILVNIIGLILFVIYIFIYQIFTANKRIYLKQFLFIILCMLGIILYDNSVDDYEQSQEFMGTVCCIITVCFFAAPLVNLIHVIKAKNSESLPFPLIITSFLASIQWLIYGILVSDMFIQIPNFLGCILSMLQLCLFVCYPPKSFAGQGYKLVEQTIIKL